MIITQTPDQPDTEMAVRAGNGYVHKILSLTISQRSTWRLESDWIAPYHALYQHEYIFPTQFTKCLKAYPWTFGCLGYYREPMAARCRRTHDSNRNRFT
jgi:hypothetical protein